MKLTLQNVNYFKDGAFHYGDYSLDITDVSPLLPQANGGIVSKFNNCFVFPAFCDVHVHLREPGFSYKETIKSGTLASARGGFTDVCSMPNLKPIPDSVDNIKLQQDIIDRDAVIRVHPYASITVNQEGKELSDFESLKNKCIAFSDDGKGVQSADLMEQAMLKAKSLNKMIVAHCEDNSLLNAGYIHDGEYARLHGHKGICSESEWGPIKRDIELARKTGCKYHVCHISCKESVELIRKAKVEGVNITCETAPHYLVFNDMDLIDEGRFKMNPPIRSEDDRLALIEGVIDGTIDMIATDHAPHSEEEKTRGLKNSFMGVVGIETAFSVMYTYLVKTNFITLKKLIELMAINPRKRFGLPINDDICVFDLNAKYNVDPKDFLSKGKFTPFEGKELYAVNRLTVCDKKIVY